jgi:hypothetical protein
LVSARLLTDQRRRDARSETRARFKLTPAGKKINALNKGTVEAATRRALNRVTPHSIDSTLDLVDKLVEELVRDE